MVKMIWYCPKCNWVSVSDSEIHHCMEICKCGETGVDLEEYGQRTMGTEPIVPIFLAIYDKGKWTRKRK